MISQEKVKDFFIVQNKKGLHTRPATELVKCTAMYKCNITLCYQDLTVNGKSLLGILMLAAVRGAKIEVIAEGDDAQLAINALLDLAKNQFYMPY